jgi:hypothetical protein
MSDIHSNPADAAAERILTAIYGEDLTGCKVSLGSISTIIAETIAEARARDQLVTRMLVEVIEKIQLIATPPDKNDIREASSPLCWVKGPMGYKRLPGKLWRHSRGSMAISPRKSSIS